MDFNGQVLDLLITDNADESEDFDIALWDGAAFQPQCDIHVIYDFQFKISAKAKVGDYSPGGMVFLKHNAAAWADAYTAEYNRVRPHAGGKDHEDRPAELEEGIGHRLTEAFLRRHPDQRAAVVHMEKTIEDSPDDIGDSTAVIFRPVIYDSQTYIVAAERDTVGWRTYPDITFGLYALGRAGVPDAVVYAEQQPGILKTLTIGPSKAR